MGKGGFSSCRYFFKYYFPSPLKRLEKGPMPMRREARKDKIFSQPSRLVFRPKESR
jgi:hypothetical protein